MKYGALIGWGVVIYAVVTLSGSALMLYGFSGTPVASVVQTLVLVITGTLAGRALRFNLWGDILPYSLCWALIAILFDGLFNMPFLGWDTYADWKLWVGYGLIIMVPLLAPYTRIRGTVRAQEY